jgi:hypothetical protein
LVKLIPIRNGPARTVLAFERDGRCETQEFLSTLPERTVRSLDGVCSAWPRSAEPARAKSAFATCEVRHSSGVRLYCFLSGRVLVCTHGGPKRAGRARLNLEIEKVMETYELCAREGLLG